MSKKFLYFFNKYQKKSLSLLFCFMFVSTVLEIVGLGFIFSIVGALSSASTKNNLFINKLNTFFELDKAEIISYLLLFFLAFYIIKIAFLTFYNWYKSNFLYSYQENLSSKVFKQYLNQNFNFFHNRNSSEFIRNLITEVEQFTLYLVSVLKLVLEIAVTIGIFCLLAYVSLYFTILISVIFLFFSCLYFFTYLSKISKMLCFQKSSNFPQGAGGGNRRRENEAYPHGRRRRPEKIINGNTIDFLISM